MPPAPVSTPQIEPRYALENDESPDVDVPMEGVAAEATGPAPRANGDDDAALAEAERALGAMEDFRLAETALQRGDIPLAERLAKKAADGDPEQAEYVALHAWIHAMSANPAHVADAIATMTTVLDADASCERALLYRGKLLKRANRQKEALKDFELLLKANPKHREAASEVRLLRMHK
jgi:tetratricopeptide (TPR) repeat protein